MVLLRWHFGKVKADVNNRKGSCGLGQGLPHWGVGLQLPPEKRVEMAGLVRE